MAAVRKTRFLSPDEYLTLEEKSDDRSEYFNGEIYLMAGGSLNHSQIIVNAVVTTGNQLAKKDCRVFSLDLRLNVLKNGLFTYPDLMVICGDIEYFSGRNDTITNPVLIIEVLSESTRDYDKGFKFELYRGIFTLQHYVLIEQDRIHVTHHARLDEHKWVMEEFDDISNVIDLDPPVLKLALFDLYSKVSFK